MHYKLFDTWTEEAAYFLGVLSVIGEVDGATLTVKAPSADRTWLRRVANIVGLKHIGISNSFSISNKQLTQPLWDMKEKHGSIPEAVPENLFHHFVRGMFDAGGSTAADIVVFVGKVKMLQKTRERLISMDITNDKSTIESEPNKLPLLKYSSDNVQRIRAFLYKQVDDLYLPYKKDMFDHDEKREDEPRKHNRAGSERPRCAGESSIILRPRNGKEPDFDSMVR